MQERITPIVPFLKIARRTLCPRWRSSWSTGRVSSLSGGDIGLSKAILDQSIVNGWTGIFPLKDDRRNTKPQQNTLMHMLEEGRFDE